MRQHNLLIAPLRGRYGTIFGLLTIECSETSQTTLIYLLTLLNN